MQRVKVEMRDRGHHQRWISSAIAEVMFKDNVLSNMSSSFDFPISINRVSWKYFLSQYIFPDFYLVLLVMI